MQDILHVGHLPLSLKRLIFQLVFCWSIITGCFAYMCIMMLLSLTLFTQVIDIIFSKVCEVCTTVTRYIFNQEVRCVVQYMVSYSHALPVVITFVLLGGNQLCGRVADSLALCQGGDVLVSVIHTKGCCSHRHFVVFCYTPRKLQERYFKIGHGNISRISPFITVQKKQLIKLLWYVFMQLCDG